MARIRTIKPEFFTSASVCDLSPLARLLFIGTWCEADKEGRLEWKPRTLKMRYLPADGCDIDALCQELIGGGLVVLYGDGLAYIPGFARHQHVNPRESRSVLPAPGGTGSEEDNPNGGAVSENQTDQEPNRRVTDASILDVHAQVGKERKGKEEEDIRVIGVTEPVTPSPAAGPADAAFGADAPPAPPPQVVPMVAPCPVDQVVALYHELLPELPAVRVFSVKRRQALHGRWRWILQSRKLGGERRATNATEALDWLRRFFERARDNDFVMGRAGRGRGHEGWRADLDYLLSDCGLLQVLERTEPAGGGLGVHGAAPGVMAG